jgi:hypothetical protein
MRTRSRRLTLLRFCTLSAKVVHYPKLVMFEEAMFSSLSPRCNNSDDSSMGPDLTGKIFVACILAHARFGALCEPGQSLGSDLSEMASERSHVSPMHRGFRAAGNSKGRHHKGEALRGEIGECGGGRGCDSAADITRLPELGRRFNELSGRLYRHTRIPIFGTTMRIVIPR